MIIVALIQVPRLVLTCTIEGFWRHGLWICVSVGVFEGKARGRVDLGLGDYKTVVIVVRLCVLFLL